MDAETAVMHCRKHAERSGNKKFDAIADLIEQQAPDKRYLTNSEKSLAEGLSLKTSELLDAQARIAELEAELARLKRLLDIASGVRTDGC